MENKNLERNIPVAVSTELLGTETVGIGRGASAAIGSLLGGNLGAFAEAAWQLQKP